jgi:hypothetical protein
VHVVGELRNGAPGPSLPVVLDLVEILAGAKEGKRYLQEIDNAADALLEVTAQVLDVEGQAAEAAVPGISKP